MMNPIEMDLKVNNITMTELTILLEDEYGYPSFMYVCGILKYDGEVITTYADHLVQFVDVEAPGVSSDVMISSPDHPGHPQNRFRLTGSIGSILGFLWQINNKERYSFAQLEAYELS